MANQTHSNKLDYINPHRFHVPVMGTGFTIDTPLKVAKYGINSVLSIGDDNLIEKMRKMYCEKFNLEFTPISKKEDEFRSKRIRAYLNLLKDLIEKQSESLKAEPFEPNTEITRYFEFLPESDLKKYYQAMLACEDALEKKQMEEHLRSMIVTGDIDVNIMTKIDKELVEKDGVKIPESGVAMSALCGFATSNLSSSVVLSAGINRRLFTYMSKFKDFYPNGNNSPKKRIVLKVSDYRSAMLQGTILAKLGLWVSEYRIESGLNCGGHAFATNGELMGPVLHEFQANRETLLKKLGKLYLEALKKLDIEIEYEPTYKLTAQGGVGTYREQEFLIDHYGCDSVGWGTPFLLVPEVTNVDEVHLEKLSKATVNDVELSDASPLDVPFWMLKNSSSDLNRMRLIDNNCPGSSCPKKYLESNKEFTDEVICKSSSEYQNLKLNQIKDLTLSDKQRDAIKNSVLMKTCLCVDLAGGALLKNKIEEKSLTAICCGISIIDYNRTFTLKEMTNHIYGREPIIHNSDRPNMFIRELKLYIEFLNKQIHKHEMKIFDLPQKYFSNYVAGLFKSIEYYRQLADILYVESKASFLESLEDAENKIILSTKKLESIFDNIEISKPVRMSVKTA